MKTANNLDKYGTWALVAGASEGLGAAFATALAQRGKSLILVARNNEKLNTLASTLRSQYKIETKAVRLDLSKKESISIIENVLIEKDCRLLIYNAAYGPVKKFLENTPEELDFYLDLNARTPLHLARIFSELHLGKSPAGFLLMASMAGMRGTSLVAPYAATKAFDWNLAEGLFYEFKDTNIDFSSTCAGPIATPNYLATDPQKFGWKPADASPESVAEEALWALGKKAVHIPGKTNRIIDLLMSRILPHSSAAKIANKTMKGMYARQWNGGYKK